MRDVVIRILIPLLLAAAVAGQSGSFTTFGQACPGSRTTGDACVRLNANTSSTPGPTSASVGHAIEVTAPCALSVVGFDLRVRSGSASDMTVSTGLYSADASGAPGKLLATGTLTATAMLAWRRTVFASPVSFAKGARFFLFFQNGTTPLRTVFATNGTAVPSFELTSSGWKKVSPALAWVAAVNCAGAAVSPALSSKDVPTLGKTMTVALDGARVNVTAILLLGGSNASWPGGSLPFPLQPFGGGNCVLYGSSEVWIHFLTDSVGHVAAGLTAPSSPSVLGATVHAQFAIDDPLASPFGVVLTNAATLVVGA